MSCYLKEISSKSWIISYGLAKRLLLPDFQLCSRDTTLFGCQFITGLQNKKLLYIWWSRVELL
ncbi:MAG: hypothetical protein D6746_09780 [Bacteroidetes bacterium]|nr:MAG: hypothetical protein D6746_09780 [Bacteroidota bacterium]